MTDPHPLDHEGRALWHLELLGCYSPEDAVAPWEPTPMHWYDDSDDDAFDDELACTRCGGEGFAEMDDPPGQSGAAASAAASSRSARLRPSRTATPAHAGTRSAWSARPASGRAAAPSSASPARMTT